MQTIFLLCLLIVGPLGSWAQPKPTLSDLPAGFQVQSYRGNPIRIKVEKPSGVESVTSILYTGKGLKKAPQQAVVLDSSSTGVTLYWPSSAQINDKSWLEIRFDNVVAAAGELAIGYGTFTGVADRDTIRFAGSDAPTLQLQLNAPTVIGGGGSGGSSEGLVLTKYYTVSNVGNNYTLPAHNGNSKIVTGDCLRSDTGLKDALWRVDPLTPNTAVLRGPSNETFTGTIVVRVFPGL